jgi:hypothetical protein
MKKREGFVSNSSTASFIVKYKEFLSKDKIPLLSEEEVRLLEDKNFFRTFAAYPHQIVPEDWQHKTEFKEDDFWNYGYDIICNEDEIIEWLLKNKIPFVADCHYDQYTLIYERNSENVIVLKNAGILYQMHDFDFLRKDIIEKPAGKIVKVEQFIKEGCSYYI